MHMIIYNPHMYISIVKPNKVIIKHKMPSLKWQQTDAWTQRQHTLGTIINITDLKNNKHRIKRSLHYNEYMFTEEINL